MQTSRFQLGLIAALAAGLGYTLSSSQAVGYPAGVAVSYGSNPVWSAAGRLVDDDAPVLVTVPSDQDLVITDVQLIVGDQDSDFDCITKWTVDLQNGADTYGNWALSQFRHYSDGDSWTPGVVHVDSTYNSGFVVPAGTPLTLTANKLYESYCSGDQFIYYNLSGYFAQP